MPLHLGRFVIRNWPRFEVNIGLNNDVPDVASTSIPHNIHEPVLAKLRSLALESL